MADDGVDVGYGRQSFAETTTAVSNVEVDNPALTLADYLRRIPGVMVTGRGNNTQVRIRGGNSVDGDSEPLFVIDNVPMAQTYRAAVQMVDINDIEDVSVLRDISASNIYGQRAKNGVVIITTK